MRLIYRVRRPSSTSLLRWFQIQQCQVNKGSSAHLHLVSIEASNSVNGSDTLLHGSSYATSASSDAVEVRKPQRRISKNERKSMVENFVKKYRETHAGKFPSAYDAMKNVGGSYYTVRQILQEVMHNSKQTVVDIRETSLEKSTKKMDDISTNKGEVPQTKELGEFIRPISKANVRNSSPKIFEPKQGQQSVETDKSKDVGSRSHLSIGKPESDQLPDFENKVKQEKLENELKFDGLEPKARTQDSTEIPGRESQKVSTRVAEPQKNPSVWNNLKSLANEILSLWRRS